MSDEIEYGENELYNSWQKKLRRLPKLHPNSCSDKCGCFVNKPKLESMNNNLSDSDILSIQSSSLYNMIYDLKI